MKRKKYEKPEAEVTVVAVERGFAATGETQVEAQVEGFEQGEW